MASTAFMSAMCLRSIRIRLGEETVIIHKDEALMVEGRIPHSCWNNTDGVTKMIGITVQ